MPDHFHFLAEGLDPASNLLSMVLSFKMKTSRAYRQQTSRVLWQKKFFDHVLRSNDSPESVAWYIWLNPVRKGLSATPDQYPFSGSFTSLIPRLHQPSPAWTPPWKPM
jgi:REP element-mobilizing transposase RayT